jgi:hypothetical protein
MESGGERDERAALPDRLQGLYQSYDAVRKGKEGFLLVAPDAQIA